jgi:hypothetical protein
VVIGVQSSDPGQGAPDASSLTFDAGNWSVPQTVTVTGQDDHVVNGDQAYAITLATSSTDANYAGQSVSVSLTNQERDVASLSVTPTSGLVTNEAGGAAQFTVALTSAPVAPVVVGVSSSDPAQGVPNVSSLTFDASNWNTPQTVTVTGQDDHVVNGDQGYAINLAASSSDPNYAGQSASVSLTNEERDIAALEVSPTSGLVTNEAGGTAQFTVALTSAPMAPVVVSVQSSDPGQGTPDVSALTFDASDWNVARTVTVAGQDDHVVNGDQIYAVNLTASSADPNYNTPTASVSLTNQERDVAGLAVSPTSGLVTDEAGGTAQFTVALTSQPTAPVVVSVTSSDPAQGTPGVASLTFDAGNWNAPQTVTVTGHDDHIVNGDQAYAVNLAASSADPNYYTPTASVSLTNQERDVAGLAVSPTSGLVTNEAGGTAQFTVALTSQPTAPVVVSVTSSDPAQGTPGVASLTFDAGNWSTAQTVTVTGQDDHVVNGDQAYAIDLAGASNDPHYGGQLARVALVNQERDVAALAVSPTSGLVTNEAGGTATFAVALTSQPTAPVVVSVQSSDPGQGTPDVSALTFDASTWNVAQAVTVTGQDDHVVNGDQPYTINLTASSADPNYNTPTASASLTNQERDVAGLAVSPTSGLVTDEAGGTAQFTVALTSAPIAPVVVRVQSSDPAQGTPDVSALTFDASDWNVAQTVTVTGQDDHIVNGDQAYGINLTTSSSDGNYAGQSVSVSLTNLERDVAGLTVSPTSGLVTDEAGGTARFTVVLSSEPTAPVVVGVNTSDRSQGTPDVAGLTFDASNWSVPQTVTVTGQDDHVVNGDQVYAINLLSSSPDGNYAGQSASVTLTNQERDAVGFALSSTSGLVTTETGGSAQFSVALTSQPAAPVVVSVSSSDPTQGTPDASAVTFDASNWNTPQTIAVTGHDDHIVHGDQSYTVSLSAASGDPQYATLLATVSLTNEERDVVGIVVTPTSGLITTNAGGTAQFTITLTSEPTAPVVLDLASTDPTAGVPSTSRLVFSVSDWNTPQTVTIIGGSDHATSFDVSYRIVVGPAGSADANYNGLTVPALELINRAVIGTAAQTPGTPPAGNGSPGTPPSHSGAENADRIVALPGRTDPDAAPWAPTVFAGSGDGSGETPYVPRTQPGAAPAPFFGAGLFGAAAPADRSDPDRPDVVSGTVPPDEQGPVTSSRTLLVVRTPRGAVQDGAPAVVAPAADPSGGADGTADTQSAAAPRWRPATRVLWQQLDQFRDQLDAESWSPAANAAVVTTVTVSVGYVIVNVRNLYLLASLLLTTPLWRQVDPLAVLDAWDEQGRSGASGPAEDRDDEEELRPILD